MATEIIKDVSIRRREVTVGLPWDEIKFVIARRALEASGLWNPNAEDGSGGATVTIVVEQEPTMPADGLRFRATVDITAALDVPPPAP